MIKEIGVILCFSKTKHKTKSMSEIPSKLIDWEDHMAFKKKKKLICHRWSRFIKVLFCYWDSMAKSGGDRGDSEDFHSVHPYTAGMRQKI